MGCQIQITKKNAITPRPDKIWQYTPYILTDDLCISQHKQIICLDEQKRAKCEGYVSSRIVGKEFLSATKSHYTFNVTF